MISIMDYLEQHYGRVADRMHEPNIKQLAQINPHVEWVYDFHHYDDVMDHLIAQGFAHFQIHTNQQAMDCFKWCKDNIPRHSYVSYSRAVFSTPDHAMLCKLSS